MLGIDWGARTRNEGLLQAQSEHLGYKEIADGALGEGEPKNRGYI